MTTANLYCSEEFLDRAVTIHDTRPNSCLVWLVDFESKVATSGSPSMYDRQEWKAFKLPTSEKFMEFLNVQMPQDKEAKTSQEYVAMFAEYQKQQLREQRLIAVATPLLAAMITNQGVCLAASLTAQVNVSMSTQQEMINKSIELAIDLFNEVAETVRS